MKGKGSEGLEKKLHHNEDKTHLDVSETHRHREARLNDESEEVANSAGEKRLGDDSTKKRQS
jgi:hypothetical protein